MMKSNIMSVLVLVLFAFVSLVDLSPSGTKKDNGGKIEFDHERNEGYIDLVANERVQDGHDESGDVEPNWKCKCDSEKKGTYCGCKEEHGRCDCDKHNVKKKECSK